MSDEDLGTARGRIEIDSSTLSKVGGALTSVGKSFLGVGGLMVAGFAVAVDAAANFEHKMSSVKAVSGATTDELEAMRKKALELGSTTIYSADQIADGFISLSKAGLSAKEIIDGAADATIQLAAAADGLTLDQSAEIIANTLRTFNLEASDAVHVADELAGAANKSTLEVTDLATSFRYAGPVAAALKIPLDDVATALAILGDRGIRGSTAGTSLRGVLLALSAPTSAAAKEMKALGLITEDGTNQFFKANGEMKSLAEVAQLLQDHTAGLTEEQKVAAFSTIFQRRAMASALVIAEQGAAGFDEYNKSIQGTSAADVAGVKLDNLSGDVTKLKNSFKTFLIEAGGPFQQTAREFVGHLQDMLDAFKQLSPEQQKFILQFLLYGGIFLVALGTLGVFAGSVLKIAGAIQILLPILSWFGSAIGLLGEGGLLAAVGDGLASVGAAIAGVVSGPILIIIAIVTAIAALGVLLYKKWQPFHDFIDRVWQAMQRQIETTVGFIQRFISIGQDLFNTLKDKIGGGISFINDVATSIADGVRTAWSAVNTFKDAVEGFVTKTIPNFIGSVVKFFQELPGKIGEGLSKAASAVGDFFTGLPRKVGYAIGYMIGSSIRFVIQFVALFIGMAVTVYNGVVSWLEQLPGRIAGFLSMLYNNAVTWGSQFLSTVITVATNVFNGVVDWFKKLPGRVMDFLNNLWDDAQIWGQQFISTAINTAVGIYNGIVDWIQKLPERIMSFFNQAKDFVVNLGQEMVNKALEIGTNIFNGIHDAIVKLPGIVGDILGQVIDAIKGAITSAFNAVKDFAGGLWDGFKDGLGINSPSYISRAVDDIVNHTSEGVTQLQKHVDTMRALSNPFSNVSNRLALTVAASQGNIGTNIIHPSEFKGSSTSHTDGDKIFITGADTKTAMEISREITTRKRVKVRG